MNRRILSLIILCFAAAAPAGFAEEQSETQKAQATSRQTQVASQTPAYSVIEVQETGGETFFRATGQVINGLFKAVAMPLQLIGTGLDYCTPKAATRRVIVPNVQPVTVTYPTIQQTVVQPAATAPTTITIVPAPAVVSPAPVVVTPAPVYYYPRYYHYRYPRYRYRGYYY